MSLAPPHLWRSGQQCVMTKNWAVSQSLSVINILVMCRLEWQGWVQGSGQRGESAYWMTAVLREKEREREKYAQASMHSPSFRGIAGENRCENSLISPRQDTLLFIGGLVLTGKANGLSLVFVLFCFSKITQLPSSLFFQ